MSEQVMNRCHLTDNLVGRADLEGLQVGRSERQIISKLNFSESNSIVTWAIVKR